MTLISSNLEKVTKNTCVFDFNIISQDNTFAEKNNYETKYGEAKILIYCFCIKNIHCSRQWGIHIFYQR